MYNDKDFLSGVVAGRALHGKHIGSKGGVITSGTLNVAANGTYDVTTYDKINVNLPHPQYSVPELLEGSTLEIPCFTQSITVFFYLTLNHIGSGYTEWDFECRSISYLNGTDGFPLAVMCPPLMVHVPGLENYLRVPDLSNIYNGKFTAPNDIANNPGNCGLSFVKSTPNLGSSEWDGRRLSFNTSTMYTVTLTGSDWTNLNHDLLFTYQGKVRV